MNEWSKHSLSRSFSQISDSFHTRKSEWMSTRVMGRVRMVQMMEMKV